MTDKQPMQAAGGDGAKGRRDGVQDTPAKHQGGESGGGAYPNPQTDKEDAGENSGFLGHGGQTEIDYSGSGGKADPSGENSNAATTGE